MKKKIKVNVLMARRTGMSMIPTNWEHKPVTPLIKRKENYYICPHCGKLTTQTRLLDECSQGGNGMCDCCFCMFIWDESGKRLETDTPRIYYKYEKVGKDLYNFLTEEENTVKRLMIFNAVPKGWRIKWNLKKN